MRTTAWEAASQIALGDCSRAAVREGQYIHKVLVKGEFHTIKILILQKVFLLVMKI